jgi:hypothetical protein
MGAEPCGQTRAESLVASGLADLAAGIADLAHSLTNSAMTSVETRMLERGRTASLNDGEFLRKAVFAGIAQNIIQSIEQRLRDEPKKPDLLSMPPNRKTELSSTR